MYQGKSEAFLDRKLRTGTRYWYEVAVCRSGGERGVEDDRRSVRAVGIYAPAEGAMVTRPPLVEWSPVRKARFYNLQLWRGNVKLLTTWVAHAETRVQERWTSRVSGVRSTDGQYRLYVWPAYGTPTRRPATASSSARCRSCVKGE